MLSAVIRSRRSYPAMLLAEQPDHQRSVHPGPLVLRADLLRSPAPTADRDRTVSRRSEPSSRTALNGEQPYPWDLLQPQLAVRLPYAFALCAGFPNRLREPLRASVTLWEATAPVKLPTRQGPCPGSRNEVRTQKKSGWYFKDGSRRTGVPLSKPPTYPTQIFPKSTAKLQ